MKKRIKRLGAGILVCAMLLTQMTIPTASIIAAETTNLALGKNIVANNYTQVYVPGNANDGNVNTYWEGASFPSTITTDLGTAQSFNKIVLRLNGSWETRTQTFSILTSSDNVNFNSLKASSNYTYDPSGGNVVTVTFADTTARYLRLSFTGNTNATGGQIAELEVYGTVTDPQPTGTPDLTVTDITYNPVSPLAGDKVTFSAVVKNQGTGATPAGTIIGVSFFVDDTQVAWSDNLSTSLAAGQSVVVTACGGPGGSSIWNAGIGNHNIRAWVDDVNRMTELNENNNQYTENMTVNMAPMSDLIVTGIASSPAIPVTGEQTTFTATVKNQGTLTGAPGVITFAVDGSEISATTNQTLTMAPGETKTYSGVWTATEVGTHSLSATVDKNNGTSEGNETNNMYTTSVTVSPKPGVDFVVTDLTWNPQYVTVGSAVSFSATIKNQGTVAGTAGEIAFKVDGSQVAVNRENGIIQAGATVTLQGTGTWQATGGMHAITVVADSKATTVETDETNNEKAMTVAVSNNDRGATLPYTRYESEDAVIGGGSVLKSAPDFNYDLIASEASNQKYVSLPTNGSYVEWTIGQGGAGVNMRFTLPDTSDGMGNRGSLDCLVNGVKVATIQLSSYWSWQYFTGDQPQDAPNGGQAAFRFDEVHWKLGTALKAGDKLRIQKSNGDNLEYGVDFVEVEPLPEMITKPSNSLSVIEYGAVPNDGKNDLDAFNSCVAAADASGKIVYIPEGQFDLGGMWTVKAKNITITGAGMWYTNIQFTSPNVASGGISFRVTGTLDFGNMYINSMLRTRYNQQAIYKCFMDNFGINSRVHDFWEEHFECGFWVADYAHTPVVVADGLVIENGRIRNNLADGVNFCQGTKNSTVRNCSVRNNGDDGLAMWPDNTMGAPMEINNSFMHNTIENNWRAAGIAIFGGSGHKAQYNYIKDCFMGSGIRLNTVFPGYHFENNTGIVFSDTTIVNSGTSKDCYNGERGAIDLEASNTSIKNITFENIDIINAQRDAIQFGYGGGFSNILFKNININGTGKDAITTSRFAAAHLGEAIYTYTNNGSATFVNLTTSNIEAPEKYLIMNGFNATIQ